jgi:hypothetical protein
LGGSLDGVLKGAIVLVEANTLDERLLWESAGRVLRDADGTRWYTRGDWEANVEILLERSILETCKVAMLGNSAYERKDI